MSSIYEHDVEMQNGSTKKFGDLAAGNVTIVVNVASKCGFTPQYKGLQELYNKYHGDGLEIVAVPCNQFGGQEPGSASAIRSFTCEVYKTTFPFTAKVEVNGSKTHPLYQQLKAEAPYSLSQAVWWNFEKMILDRDGNVVSRYGSTTTPEGLEAEIKDLLAKKPAHGGAMAERVAVAPAKAEGAAGGGGGGAAEAVAESAAAKEEDAPPAGSKGASGGEGGDSK